MKLLNYKIQKSADKTTEALIYFIIIFSPWAFGTTEKWSTFTMIVTSFFLAILFMIKWISRFTMMGRNPDEKFNFENSSPKKDKCALIIKYCNRFTAIFMVMLILYMLISAVNARASFDLSSNEYFYYTKFNENLPHSYNARATWELVWQFLSLFIIFWSVKDWISGRQFRSNSLKLSSRFKKLLIAICINAGILAFVCILQRIYYGEANGKLLFLIETRLNKANISQFGPFAYRGNAASYFNLIWPIFLGLLIHIGKSNIEFSKKRIGAGHELILIPLIIIIWACPIISSSRGGAFVLIGLTILVIVSIPFLNIKSKFLLRSLIGCILFAILISHQLGWDNLESRLMTIFRDNFSSRKQLYETINLMLENYVFSNTPPSPFGAGPGSFEAIIKFELGENMKRWESWAHNDYLETLLTFGIPGTIIFSLIFISQGVIILVKCIYSNNSQLYFLIAVSFLGLAVHAMGDFPFQVYSINILLFLILASTSTNE